MAHSFFEGRKLVKAEDLRGPRVYSTDMLPSHFDRSNPKESVAITARALKIKIITKGLVTLNSIYLVSPLGVLLLDAHPDLFEGTAILPAFRTDKSNFSELISSAGGHAAAGIDDAHLRDHIAKLEGSIKQAMPWSLGTVGDAFRMTVVKGLRNPDSFIVKELASGCGLARNDVERMATEIEGLDFSDSLNVRTYVSKLDDKIRAPLTRYVSACYHVVGTGVVRCETGTDLNPLSEFKAADILLAGRDGRPEMLSDDVLFLEAFMGFALDTIQASVLPTQLIDAVTFDNAQKISDALRDQGFQQKYDEITSKYVASIAHGDGHDALERLDEAAIATTAADLAKTFQKEIIAELPNYKPAIQADAKEKLYRSGADVALDAVGAVPGIGNIVSIADLAKDLAAASGDLADVLTVRNQQKAFAEAQKQRTEKIQAAINSLKTNQQKKTRLLDAVALLSDVHAISIKRA
jgi:hypothetical protein